MSCGQPKSSNEMPRYVVEDQMPAFCLYDAPGPEVIRNTASRNELPVDQITGVRVLDLYFYA